MSLRNLPYQQGKLTLENFEAHNSFTIKEDINSISHCVNESTGEYVIKDSQNNKILSVNMNGTLTQPSYIKTHITNAVAPVSSQVGIHQQRLTEHENRLSTLETTVPTDENFTNLQNQVQELQSYVNNMKSFMNTFKNSLEISGLDFSHII